VSDLTHGLAPKMKPISRRRSAIVCALDIGTSKIVCAIARLKPRPPQDVLPRRTHSVDVLGIGHSQAQGMKSGTVVDIAAAEEALRYAVDIAERAAGVHVDSVVLPITAGRTASELFAATVHMKAPTRARGREPPFGARGPRGAAFAPDRLRARRQPRHP
jgi:cell division protein FtsA